MEFKSISKPVFVGTTSSTSGEIVSTTIQSSSGAAGSGSSALPMGTGLSLLENQFNTHGFNYNNGSNVSRLSAQSGAAFHNTALINNTDSDKNIYMRISANNNFDSKGYIVVSGFSGSGGSANTINLNTHVSVDDLYNGYKILVISGASGGGSNTTADIDAFNGTTKIATLDNFTVAPSSTSLNTKTFFIYKETAQVMFFLEYMHLSY